MRYTRYYLTNNDCYKTAQKMPSNKPKGIIIHSTGANNPYLKRYIAPDDGIIGANTYGNHWNQGGLDVCVHGFIGKDKNNSVKCYQILPWNYCCWGCGRGSKGSYNYNPAYIQIEICEDNLTNKEYYTEVFTLAKELCVDLCKEFNISVSNIVSHAEASKLGYASNHADCDHWLKNFGDTMDDFRKDVEKLLNTSNTSSGTTPTTTKDVTVTVGKVQSYLRDDGRTDAKVLNTLKPGTTLTWLSDDGWGWSKCKYGKVTGWIQNSRITGKSNLSKWKTLTIDGNAVNIRKTCSTKNKNNIYKTVNRGYKCTLICIRSDNWLNVFIDGKDYFVYYDKSYCKIS